MSHKAVRNENNNAQQFGTHAGVAMPVTLKRHANTTLLVTTKFRRKY
jgi:hypothetical protein